MRIPRKSPPALLVGALVAVLLCAGLTGVGQALSASATEASAPAARTWVVDAVDDEDGNRFESRDTGTSVVTINVGDTVEWRFEWPTAAQEHDLTSVDTPPGIWIPAVQEYRVPDDPQGPVTYTFTEPGTFQYICSIHGSTMTGTVVVEEPGDAGDTLTVDASASPTTGPAPLDVTFTGAVDDADGASASLTYAWNFGDGTTAQGPGLGHVYTADGAYTATLTVTAADGRTGTDSVGITVTDGQAHHQLPAISATATASAGTVPLPVAFSTEVTTGGPVTAFASGLTSNPDITGTATLVRRRGATYASINVTGLAANAMHMVHVHEEACSSNSGGAHFRFDTTQPFAQENEIWAPFTSDAQGRSGLVEVTRPRRAGADAISMVVHHPDNPALRIGCADLDPPTADLAYSWDFGDGTTGQGADPDHVYTAAGTHTATLTVTDGSGNSAVDTVQVAATEAPVPAPPGLGPAPLDVDAPQTAATGGPSGAVRARRATFRLTSSEAGSTFTCSLDGGAWQACPARATLRGLSERRHRLLVRATDTAGNTDTTPAARAWTVDRTGPTIRKARPPLVTVDRTPLVQARVGDALSPVRRVVLRIDGDRVGPVRVMRHRVVWKARRPLPIGWHRVRLIATDIAGNRSSRAWRFRISR